MKKNLVVFLTHKFNKVLLKNIENSGGCDVIVLFDKSADLNKNYNLLSSADKKIVDSVDLVSGLRTNMKYDPKGGHSMYYHFFKGNYNYLNEYEYIWIFENDVYFSGKINRIISAHNHMKHDVLVSEYGGRGPKWGWFPGALYDEFKNQYDYTGVLACVCRFSTKYMQTFIENMGKEFDGYLEIIIPLICKKYDLNIAQFIPNYIGKSYHVENPFTRMSANKLKSNTPFVGYLKDKLYHPVKL